MKQEKSIHDLMYLVNHCLKSLHVDLYKMDLENIVLLLYNSLKPKGRFFHSIQHAFDLTRDDHPAISLAALFHDLVYYQIDEGFTKEVYEIISPYICEVPRDGNTLNQISLKEDLPSHDSILQITLSLFSFKEGQILNIFGGLNEFLSALVMGKTFSKILSTDLLVQMITYVEGTIPFRGPSADGLPYFQTLSQRLENTNQLFRLSWSQHKIDTVIRDAVELANQDVLNFAEEDVRDFLDNTWDLIPETNMPLRYEGLYTIQDYRFALQKMLGFFNFLNPDYIFHQYQDTPSIETFNTLTQKAHHNVRIARQYLQIKLVTISILEAFAIHTGGNCPVCLFMGDLPKHDTNTKRLEHYLPTIEIPSTHKFDENILLLLDQGRNKTTSFDLKNAPLSLFVYTYCSDEVITILTEQAQQMFTGSLSAYDFLIQVPSYLRSSIAQALSNMVFSRKSLFTEFI